MSAPRTPPPLRSFPRYRPAGRGPAGRALGAAALLVGLVAAGRAAWLARARRRFAGLRGPRFEKAVGAPAVRPGATAGAGDGDDASVVVAPAGRGDDGSVVDVTVDPGTGGHDAAPIVDATVIEGGERSFAADTVPDGIVDATVVDDEPDESGTTR